MATSIRRTNARGSKRTKTFTGCWTCRSRKVKCDEGRPRCRVCLSRDLACEGYGARLQWLAPDTGDGENSQSAALTTPSSRAAPLRSQIPTVPPESVLPLHRVEDILRIIDSLDASSNVPSNVPGDNVSVNLHNFGVFDLGWSRPASNTPSQNIPAYSQFVPAGPLDTELWDYTALHYSASPDAPIDAIATGITPLVSAGGSVSPSCSETAAAWDLCRLHNQGTPVAANLQPLDNTPLAATDNPTQYRRRMSNASVSSMVSSPLGSCPVGNDSPLNFPLTTPASSPMAKRERFLLYHYMNRVVNLFCVIDNARSPWKTIHLTRVLQSAGELSIAGSTSRTRDALTKALLSISAFYMSNDYKARRLAEEARQWEDSATRFRGDAIGLLKQAVETDLYSGVRPRYKEFLATMLSMITINVMSGDTSTCGVHLDGAEQLIIHMSSRKRKFSKKAQSLHRIYYYLRAIYESTTWRRHNTSSRFSTLLNLREDSDPDSINVYYRDPHGAIESPTSVASIEGSPVVEMDTYESIYGIPQGLLILLRKTIELIGLVDDARGKSESSFIPEELSVSCDELERNILDWPLEEQLARCQSLHAEISSKIIYHQTRAFYHALVIYFSQNIRLLSYRYLHQYIEAVLESIEAIENIKTQTKILAAPLFWPAFITATEAFEKNHQERFKTWHNTVEVYGIAAARTGIQVVDQIWKQGPCSSKRPMSSWRAITKETGVCLMLT
ncbi:hypothetical protein NUW58_g3825 [Xylaria curta]|uniref:Uncharacterized protein n=1 Tax=Xylaria curta TaxID=42375 RepID=A0ACC1PBT6_9PEZI|nr:hypothetical protein NUW58_g3825 [Xylaria curta]